MEHLTPARRAFLRQWSPAFISGGVAWLLLLVIGETPFARASGLALTVLGVAASMRAMGFVASIAGGLTLALCPVFWSQTGGAPSQPATIVIAIATAGAVALAASQLLRRGDLGIGLGIVIFVLIFWSQVGTAQSLRLTGLACAWLLYLLADMILLTNPRPGLKPARSPKPWHTQGLLFLFVIGTLNDPLVTLLAPALLLALFLSYARLPAWYWLAILATVLIGGLLLARAYLSATPALIDPGGWQDATRWIALGELVIEQFSVIGIVLGVVGLARLSRWYPPLGVVTMIAYAAYAFFGLVYAGPHMEILLIPLFIVQILWMTYAVNTFGQWVNKSLAAASGRWIHLVSALYFALPGLLLLEILASR